MRISPQGVLDQDGVHASVWPVTADWAFLLDPPFREDVQNHPSSNG